MTSPYFSSISLTSSPPTPSLLEPVYRRFQSSVSCDNAIYGCHKRFYTIGERQDHKELCEFGPSTRTECPDCHRVVQRSQLRRHNCIRELSSTINELKEIIVSLEEKVNQQTIHLNECRQILDATPQLITTEEVDFTTSVVHLTEDNHSIEVFESEPDITPFKETYKRQESKDANKVADSPEPSYRRTAISKQISKQSFDYKMYGSLTHKYLAQLSHELSGDLPPIDYDLDPTLEFDLKKKNKEKLIDIRKDEIDSKGKPPLVRIRSWSERE